MSRARRSGAVAASALANRRKCAEAGSESLDIDSEFAREDAVAQANWTTILPMFRPWNRPMKASTARSSSFATVSLFFRLLEFSLPVQPITDDEALHGESFGGDVEQIGRAGARLYFVVAGDAAAGPFPPNRLSQQHGTGATSPVVRPHCPLRRQPRR